VWPKTIAALLFVIILNMQHEIRTRRLALRPLRVGDEQYTFPAVDEELTRYWIGWEPSVNLADEKSRLEKIIAIVQSGQSGSFLAFDSNQKFVGYCAVMPYREFNEHEIDLWIVKKQQGKGYSGEMLSAIIDWARKNLKVPYVIYSITEGNEKSFNAIKKLNLPVHRKFVAIKRGEKKLVTDYRISLR
jgi:RimJ/RimL family protein N-acetyltransferase